MTKTKFSISLLLCLAMLFSCSPKDDIRGIFVDKTWKMSNINSCSGLKDDGKPTLTEAEVDQAIVSGHFQILFKDGTFTGRATNATFSGNWSANDKDNTFNVNITKMEGTEATALGNRFINLFKNGKYYMGDYLALKIFDGDQKEYILFRPQN